MRRFFAARLLQSVIVVAVVTTITFFLIRLAPGDPFAYESPRVTPAVRATWRAQFGYDRPLPEQYARWLASVARGRLGYSHSLQQPVARALFPALGRTLLLVSISLALSFALGMALGVVQASRRGSWTDRLTGTVLLVFYSVPDFWLALMLLLALGYWVPLFPAGGMVDVVLHDYMGPWGRFADRARHLVLPVTALTLLSAAAVARYQRAAMLDVLPQEYVLAARAKGLRERDVVWRHALRNALLPVITLLGLWLPALVGGAVFVEKVFAWPGMGLLTINAIATRDYDLVTAAVIAGGVVVAVGSLAADLLYAAVDPRLRDR